MQEDEFEKQVQQKMHAFQLQPGEAVWQNVRSQVAKQKEDKRKYVIFSFLLLALLASSLWLTDLEQPTASRNKKAKTGTKENLSRDITENGLQQPQLKNKQQQLVIPAATDPYNGNKTSQTSFTKTNKNTSADKIKSKTRGIMKATITAAIISETEAVKDENIPPQNEQLPSAVAVEDEVKQENKNNEPQEGLVSEQVQNEPKKENTALATAAQPSTQNTKNNFWNTAILLSIGRSSPVNNATTKSATADYNNNTGSIPVNNGGGLGTSYSPSATKAGISLVAGFELSRYLSAKTTLGMGLQYQLFTTSIVTGEEVNTQLASVRDAQYMPGNSNQYNSYYHFITLPVSLTTQIASIKDREITMNTAINFSRLIYTNALSFDYAQGSYYMDKSVFNKTIVGLSAAVFINLAGKNETPFYIGPDLYYSLTTQAASGMYAASHYSSFGITLKKMF